jgi:hypothetical protein
MPKVVKSKVVDFMKAYWGRSGIALLIPNLGAGLRQMDIFTPLPPKLQEITGGWVGPSDLLDLLENL